MTCRLWWCVEMENKDVDFQYGGRLGEFNSMLSQSHVSHCRVLPLGEFTVTIPEPHATFAGCSHLTKSMSWSCHIAGCNNSICHIENRFCNILFLMQFRLWRAAAFVSSPIHLLINVLYATIRLIVATHQVTTQFERRPYSIQSYPFNPGLLKWIKAVITVG